MSAYLADATTMKRRSNCPLRTTRCTAIRYYQDGSAKLHKGTVALNPALRTERRLVGVEIKGPKVTPFAHAGRLMSMNWSCFPLSASRLFSTNCYPRTR